MKKRTLILVVVIGSILGIMENAIFLYLLMLLEGLLI